MDEFNTDTEVPASPKFSYNQSLMSDGIISSADYTTVHSSPLLCASTPDTTDLNIIRTVRSRNPLRRQYSISSSKDNVSSLNSTTTSSSNSPELHTFRSNSRISSNISKSCRLESSKSKSLDLFDRPNQREDLARFTSLSSIPENRRISDWVEQLQEEEILLEVQHRSPVSLDNGYRPVQVSSISNFEEVPNDPASVDATNQTDNYSTMNWLDSDIEETAITGETRSSLDYVHTSQFQVEQGFLDYQDILEVDTNSENSLADLSCNRKKEGNPEENLPNSYQRRKCSNLLSEENHQVEEKDQLEHNTSSSLVMETSKNQRTILDETKNMIYLLLKLLLLYTVFVLIIFHFLVPL